MLKNLKAFLMRGNVIDLAVAVIIGGAFNRIIDALVSKVFTPFLGVLTGGINFKDSQVSLLGVEVGWGAVVQSVIDFFIMGLALYLFLRATGQHAGAPAPTPTEATLAEIRDLLKEQNELARKQ